MSGREWATGGAERFVFVQRDHWRAWAAVWAADGRWVAWVMDETGRHVSHHATEAAAKAWAEEVLG